LKVERGERREGEKGKKGVDMKAKGRVFVRWYLRPVVETVRLVLTRGDER
jgi:hypothetical protein